MTNHEQVDAFAMRKTIDELLVTWQANHQRVEIKGLPPAQFSLMYGVTAHCQALTRAAVTVLDSGQVVAAYPLVRDAYEHGITAQWLLLVNDGTQAFMNESHRQRKNVIRAGELVHHFADPISPKVAEETARVYDTTSESSARHFEKMCDDLEPGGKRAYLIYRILFPYSHASAFVTDKYLDLSDGDEVPRLRLEARLDDDEKALLFYVLLQALVWSGQAVDQRMVGHSRRSQLKAIAQRVGIPYKLGISGKAYGRQKTQ